MKIIPAIDIMDKMVVRLEQGRFEKGKVYSQNPVSAAKKWKEKGADLIHVVDLDGARLGKPINMDIVSEIKKNVNIDIELGGGLRAKEDLDKAFKAGVKFVVIGTSAVSDESFCRSALGAFKDKVICACDAKDGNVAIKGWKEISSLTVGEYIQKVENYGAKKIIYTDISRDGMMSGPNLERLKAILESTSIEIIASGGVSTIDDIKALKAIGNPRLTGVIIGKALYEDKIDLAEAIKCLQKE